jgi:hypothetical protein
MNSIVNMFYVLDNSVENAESKQSKFKNTYISTPALNQGMNFKKYQNKIINNIKPDINNVNSREGFKNFNNPNTSYDLAERSKQILNETNSGKDDSLQKEYNSVLLEYQKKLAEVSGGTSDFINRVSPNNPYLNKYIHWTDPSANGSRMYVTNQGVAKPITDWSIYEGILGKNGCPDDKSVVDITIPWDSSYIVEGTIIPTSPSLIVGTPMKANESCGNEGLNVYVDKLIKNSTAKYNGCYADDISSRSMSFIGGSPPDNSNTFIINGDFSQSQIANNSYKYLTWDTTTVPGWNFNCVLVNNSSAWGYPMPYPNGNQCACIQKNQELWTSNWMNFSPGVTYTISFDACGRNCCDGSGKSNPIDVGLEGKTFYSFTPPVNKWTKYSTNFTVDSQQSMRISFKGTWTAGDRSTALQNIAINKGPSSSGSGTYTYDMCKNAAIDSGYKYFALQNVNTETSMGYCGVSNDSVAITKNGTAYAVNKSIPLWDSKTNGSGVSASLTDQGTLTVYNSASSAIFNTPTDSSLSAGYIGCYGDTDKRAMPNTSNGKYYPFDTCKQYAIDGGYKYYGSQNKDGNNNGWCVASNDLASSQKYGVANNCTKDISGNYMGGPWSNAIYSIDSKGVYFLILQDDGNMVIYKGSGPNDNQGAIWSSKTNGKQQKANPYYTAAKGKYGKNWISSGTTLATGDFIGSTDGSIYLIMQSDGNLVLYTSDNSENCQKMKDGNTGGGENANALYELSEVGIPDNLGKLGYIDSNSLLSIYGDSNIEQTTNGQPPKLKNLPVGISNKIVNIDSITFENYPKSDKINTSYNLANASTTQKQELEQLKTRLDQISQQLANNTGTLNTDEVKVENQSTLQTQSIAKYLKEYKKTNSKIKNHISNMNNGIVNDSDINVLKENYNYYFWSILAVGTVLVTMNITKK